MTSDAALSSSLAQPAQGATDIAKQPRVWPAVVLVGLYWLCEPTLRWLDVPGFAAWLMMMAALAALMLLFAVWWLTNRRIRGRDRLWGLGAAIGGGIASALLSKKVGIAWLMLVLPWLFTVWAAWLLVARRMSAHTRRAGLLAALLLLWGIFTLIRLDGLRGDGGADLHWRWTPTAEELYNAERAQAKSDPLSLQSGPLHLQPGDWPGFRGPDRDGVVRGVKIATDWKANPPKKLWRQRVGPGWSSFAVVGERLFTQEQRGQSEAVVCLEAATGREVWGHEDAARFTDDQAGPGPRATPTFADGRLYTLGRRASSTVWTRPRGSGSGPITSPPTPAPSRPFGASPIRLWLSKTPLSSSPAARATRACWPIAPIRASWSGPPPRGKTVSHRHNRRRCAARNRSSLSAITT